MRERGPRPAEYHKLSVREKQRLWLTGGVAARELCRCPACAVQLVAGQLENHQRERCVGSPFAVRGLSGRRTTRK